MDRYKNLTVTIHTKRSKKTTGCNYRYLIHFNNFSHTAFRNQKAFRNWLYKTGLKAGKRTGRWRYNTLELIGTYYKNSLMDEDFFNKIKGENLPVLSNGDYTLGKITNYKGNRVINYLNPNCNRVIYNHQAIEQNNGTFNDN